MREMLLLTQTPGGGGGVGVSCKIPSSPLKPTHKNKRLLSNPTTTKKPLIFLTKQKQSPYLACAKPQNDTTQKQQKQQPNNVPLSNDPVFVGPEDVPLEGVIQIEKEKSFSFDKWGRIALLAGGDVLALLLFSAIGRFSHGFPVLDSDTLRTADPFIAGWVLAAYFLGGYGEDGRGINGMSKGVIAAAKSWALGIPLGILIRAVTLGKTPSYPFVLVTMGSTAALLIGWRTIASKVLAVDKSKKSDAYRRGSPFELFELLTSLVRRW